MCDNITLTGEMVFRGSTLSNIRFSNNLSKITHSMFRDCKNLEIFNAKRITKIGKTAFSNSAIKEFNVEYFYCDDVEDSAFQNCENLESFDLKGVSTLSYAAFYQSGIKTLYNVNSLKFIDSNAFFNCTELTEFTCPTTLEYIGNSVFRGCKKLSSFTLNSELKYFGKDVLYNTAVTFNTKNNAKYYGCGINDYFLLYSMQDDATYLTIDEDCRIIAGSACNTKSLTSITIPSNVVSIGAYAFSDCASLKTVTIDKNGPLEIIGEYAFENTIIESIELPLYDLRMIGECAFKNTNLINVTCNYTQFYYDVAQIDSVLSCLAFGIDENQWYVYTVSTDFAEKLKNGNKNYIRYVSVLS